MKLSDLTEKSAVDQSIAEFDALGRETFLSKYGYKKAKRYFVLQDGRRYDSKAIAGVAVGKQFPNLGPMRPEDFSGGEATVETKLRSLGFDFEVLPAAPRNPPWTRDETILAMDLYVRRRPHLPGEGDGEIIALSGFLGTLAQMNGVSGDEKIRNPNGVSMKVANLSRLDQADERKGLAHGANAERAVWEEFIDQPARLYSEAERILRLVPQNDDVVPKLGRSERAVSLRTYDDGRVSRGPRPSFGDVTYTKTDGDNLVYVMQLHGQLGDIFPSRSLADNAVIKIGRTNDLNRRLNEMNCGFPPGMTLEWRGVYTRKFENADGAHDAEQFLLRKLKEEKLAIGREFSVVPNDMLPKLLLLIDDREGG